MRVTPTKNCPIFAKSDKIVLILIIPGNDDELNVTNDTVVVYVTTMSVLSFVAGFKTAGKENESAYPIFTLYEARAGLK